MAFDQEIIALFSTSVTKTAILNRPSAFTHLIFQSISLKLTLMHSNKSCVGVFSIKTTSAVLVSANYTDSTILLSRELKAAGVCFHLQPIHHFCQVHFSKFYSVPF